MPPPVAPGMTPAHAHPHAEDRALDELARVTPHEGDRPLLVVHRREACSGSAAIVLLDEHGTFYGSVAPGEAALLEVPTTLKELQVLSSVEVTAPLHTSFVRDEIAVPPFPGGLLVTPRRANARDCWSTGQYATVRAATREELEEVLGDAKVIWLEPRPLDGQRWLERHRPRIDEIFAGRAERCLPSPLRSPSYCPEGNAPLDALVPPR